MKQLVNRQVHFRRVSIKYVVFSQLPIMFAPCVYFYYCNNTLYSILYAVCDDRDMQKKNERKEVGHAIRFTAQHIHDPVFLDTIQI